MADTRLLEAIDAVLASWRAVLTAPVQVYDGPIVTGDYAKDALFVGYDGDPNGDFIAGTVQQVYTGPGDRVKNETVVVNCAAVSWSGDMDMKTRRDACGVLFAAANAALRANPSQGLALPSSFNLGQGAYYQEPGPQGLQARLVFTITATVRV